MRANARLGKGDSFYQRLPSDGVSRKATPTFLFSMIRVRSQATGKFFYQSFRYIEQSNINKKQTRYIATIAFFGDKKKLGSIRRRMKTFTSNK